MVVLVVVVAALGVVNTSLNEKAASAEEGITGTRRLNIITQNTKNNKNSNNETQTHKEGKLKLTCGSALDLGPWRAAPCSQQVTLNQALESLKAEPAKMQLLVREDLGILQGPDERAPPLWAPMVGAS